MEKLFFIFDLNVEAPFQYHFLAPIWKKSF